eukprot:GILK01013673.1.p1 GENE.GILK01013673.1~~GILK01013673.1.p1  ORF type:complete len:469 (-),score=9.27 GILK01013673.1:258-1664(-)
MNCRCVGCSNMASKACEYALCGAHCPGCLTHIVSSIPIVDYPALSDTATTCAWAPDCTRNADAPCPHTTCLNHCPGCPFHEQCRGIAHAINFASRVGLHTSFTPRGMEFSAPRGGLSSSPSCLYSECRNKASSSCDNSMCGAHCRGCSMHADPDQCRDSSCLNKAARACGNDMCGLHCSGCDIHVDPEQCIHRDCSNKAAKACEGHLCAAHCPGKGCSVHKQAVKPSKSVPGKAVPNLPPAALPVAKETRTKSHSSTPSVYSHEIAYYWDIENCHIPRGCDPIALVDKIRKRFVVSKSVKEVCFYVYGDHTALPMDIQQGLDRANVDLIHVPQRDKAGASDSKMMNAMMRLVSERTSAEPLTIVVITGDVDFASTLADIKNRHCHHVALLHNKQTRHALLVSASEAAEWTSFAQSISARKKTAPVAAPLPTPEKPKSTLCRHSGCENNYAKQCDNKLCGRHCPGCYTH